jgi:hypothetical protein
MTGKKKEVYQLLKLKKIFAITLIVAFSMMMATAVFADPDPAVDGTIFYEYVEGEYVAAPVASMHTIATVSNVDGEVTITFKPAYVPYIDSVYVDADDFDYDDGVITYTVDGSTPVDSEIVIIVPPNPGHPGGIQLLDYFLIVPDGYSYTA